jgi:multiple sugar transport system ATP-binding protein
MATVTFDRASRLYPGADTPAVNELELEILDGEFLVVVGPSGCGKSTALRMLAGLEEVTSGRIMIGDRDVTHIAPKDRDIAMVFQNYALYPHMTVAENMGFALKIKGTPKDEIITRVKEAAKILDLEQYLERKPKALSGGQRQRVAMGRAIVRQPQVFLMDEPLSNLDAKLRVSTRTQIASLQRRLGITTLYVTHDQIEAMTMGDRVAVLKDGLLQQVDSPLNLYDHPGNVFVAGFIGSPAMNIGEFTLDGDKAVAPYGTLNVPAPVANAARADGKITIGFRPEGIELADQGAENAFPVDVDIVEELGSDAFVYGEPAVPGSVLHSENLIARIDPHDAPRKGDQIWVRPKAHAMHFFMASSGQRINSETGQVLTAAR